MNKLSIRILWSWQPRPVHSVVCYRANCSYVAKEWGSGTNFRRLVLRTVWVGKMSPPQDECTSLDYCFWKHYCVSNTVCTSHTELSDGWCKSAGQADTTNKNKVRKRAAGWLCFHSIKISGLLYWNFQRSGITYLNLVGQLTGQSSSPPGSWQIASQPASCLPKPPEFSIFLGKKMKAYQGNQLFDFYWKYQQSCILKKQTNSLILWNLHFQLGNSFPGNNSRNPKLILWNLHFLLENLFPRNNFSISVSPCSCPFHVFQHSRKLWLKTIAHMYWPKYFVPIKELKYIWIDFFLKLEKISFALKPTILNSSAKWAYLLI